MCPAHTPGNPCRPAAPADPDTAPIGRDGPCAATGRPTCAPARGRRTLLRALGAGWLAMAAGLTPWPVQAGNRVRRAFLPEPMERVLADLGADAAEPSSAIKLLLPDVAEDGTAVQMSLATTLPARRALVLVRRNRIPLVAEFEFAPGTLPFVAARIKMAEDSEVLALVEAEGRWYSASRQVKVTVGGCGG
ncbi:MAG: thiosulfate oxidation carrier protein SoxY [Rhodocyclaceae bacterium]|nr:thiosulfate oxidation carrier protein SoxY [Rhodocyclaceae bacterium]